MAKVEPSAKFLKLSNCPVEVFPLKVRHERHFQILMAWYFARNYHAIDIWEKSYSGSVNFGSIPK